MNIIISIIVFILVVNILMFVFMYGVGKQNKRYDDCFDNYIKRLKNGKT